MAALDADMDSASVSPVRRHRRLGVLFFAAIAWILLVAFGAIFAGWLPIPSPTDIDFLGKRAPPSAEHWLGNDQLGRDVFSRLVYGGRISLAVGLAAMLVSVFIGTLIGVGRLSPNWLLSRICEWYVECFRNVPLLLILYFWYRGVLGLLPEPRDSIKSNCSLKIPSWQRYVIFPSNLFLSN